MIKKFMFTLAPFLYMVMVWVLSSLPSDAVINTSFSFDRAFKESLHLVEFGILYLLFVAALIVNGKFSKKFNMIVAIVAILYGLVDEIHQSFVPYRSATIIDFVKDTIGVLVLFYVVKSRNKG